MLGEKRVFGVVGAFFGFVAVGFGAFGAHALRDHLDADMLAVFETGVRYQLYHALALLLVDRLAAEGHRFTRAAGWLMIVGVVIFSGSLYVLALSGVKLWGAVTPVGGICILSGWVTLATAYLFCATAPNRVRLNGSNP